MTYDGIARHTAWGVFDTRYAQDFTLGGRNVLLGVSVNNYPTVQDPWNSTPAWQFPFPFRPPRKLFRCGAADPRPLRDASSGTTVYTMIDNTVYLEAGGYRKLSDRLQEDVGIPDPAAEHGIDGTAAYWRAARQRTTGPHYASVGIVGFAPHAQSPQERSLGTDNYTDLGYDATYQFANGGPHTFNANASYIQEHQRLFGTTALGASSSVANHINTFTVSGQYAYQQTYSVTLGYFIIVGQLQCCALSTVTVVRQCEQQPRQPLLHRADGVCAVRQGRLFCPSVAEHALRAAVHRLHAPQRRQHELRRLRALGARQQHTVPVLLDSDLS